jgi:predicted GNAT family N-acyltransferase
MAVRFTMKQVNVAAAMEAADDNMDKVRFIKKLAKLEARIAELEQKIEYKEANGLDDTQEVVEHILRLAEHADLVDTIEQI